jgi:NADH-quinone oxidoreductase subunit J
MPWDMIAFFLIAAICVVCAAGVVVAKNPVHAGVFLGLCFIQVAGLFVMMGAEFLAVVQVIVYTGAILVLLLFVLLLVDPEDLPEFHTARPVQRTVGLLLGLVLLLEIGVAILGRTISGAPGNATPQNVELVGGNVQALGRTLYTEYIFPFEVVSLVLTVGVVGAIVLAMPERLGERVRRRGTISLGHPRGVDAALPAGQSLDETPVPGDERMLAPAPGARRGVILVRDPDQYTTVGSSTATTTKR